MTKSSEPKKIFTSIDYLKGSRTEAEWKEMMLNEWALPDPVKIIYLLIRDYAAACIYQGWYRNHIDNNPNIIFKCIREVHDLAGRSGIEIHLATTCREHERYNEIMAYINVLVQAGKATVKEVEW